MCVKILASYATCHDHIQRSSVTQAANHVSALLKFFATPTDLVPLMKSALVIGCSLVFRSTCSLMATACVADVDTWERGFPSSPDAQKKYHAQPQEWLKNTLDRQPLEAGVSTKIQTNMGRNSSEKQLHGLASPHLMQNISPCNQFPLAGKSHRSKRKHRRERRRHRGTRKKITKKTTNMSRRHRMMCLQKSSARRCQS